MRLIQISDTHISRAHGPFEGNVEIVRRWLAGNPCDLVVNTGDLSMNGAVTADDLQDAAEWHRRLGAPVLSVPGNHDVGDVPELRADQVLDHARLERFRALIGPDRWVREVAGWRLIGLNGMLLGTGHPDEDVQFDWLAEAVAGDAPTAIFLHKPLFVADAAEEPFGYWTVPPAPRRRVLELLARADVRLVASGHLHVARIRTFGAVSHVWAPSGAFVCGPTQPPEVPGERRIGLVVHDFGPDAVDSRVVFLDGEGAQNLTIDPHLDVIYPAPTALEAARG